MVYYFAVRFRLYEMVNMFFSVVPRSSMEKTVFVCGLSICAVVPHLVRNLLNPYCL